MPGLSGIETLNKIKLINSTIPVVMITKSEEENIMEMAIGSKIADYLIKPVNPNQILLSIKKNLETKKLITRETTSAYQSEFRILGDHINMASSFSDWVEIYRKLVYWELELERSNDTSMFEVFRMQNQKLVWVLPLCRNNYLTWFSDRTMAATYLCQCFQGESFPLVDQNQKGFVILIDNLRLDQWRVLYPIISNSTSR
jgi:hypothetical protein